MGAGESCVFIAVNDGLMVVCDGWAGGSDGAAACEEDGSSVNGDGVGSDDCDLDSLDRKRSLNLTGISIKTLRLCSWKGVRSM